MGLQLPDRKAAAGQPTIMVLASSWSRRLFEIDVATPANTNIRNQGKYQELKEQLVQK